MKTSSTSFLVGKPLLLALFLNLPAAANPQSINFQTVPITMAIENLARTEQINFIINPKLFHNADGSPKPEPSLTIQWDCTPAEALARVIKENNLVMVTNAFTTVVRITGTNNVASSVDAKLLGTDTNGVIPVVYFADVPLGQALDSVIKQGRLPIGLDPRVSGEAPPQPPDFKMVRMPMLSIRWHDLTARQVIVEICENYDLKIVKGSSPDSFLIIPKP
jgi:hypothetical protein